MALALIVDNGMKGEIVSLKDALLRQVTAHLRDTTIPDIAHEVRLALEDELKQHIAAVQKAVEQHYVELKQEIADVRRLLFTAAAGGSELNTKETAHGE